MAEPLCGRALEYLFELRQPVGEHRLEAMLFGPNHLDDRLAPGRQFGVRIAHEVDQLACQAVEERLGEPEAFPVAHRAPHDLPQDVAAPLVARQHAVGDEERHGAQVVGDDA